MADDADVMFDALTETSCTIATLTGIKAQFINSGWSEPMAETMVFEMLKHA